MVDGPNGPRQIAARDFFLSVWTTAAEPDEIITHLRFPITSPNSGYAIEEFALRSGDFALTGSTAAITAGSDGTITHAALGFMGMGMTPLRAANAEEQLIGRPLDSVDVVAAAEAAVGTLSPSDDVHASAAYRSQVATKLCSDALRSAIEEARRG